MDKAQEDILIEMGAMVYGSTLKLYLDEEIRRMTDISTIKGSLEEKGKIVEARFEAIKILKGCFWFLEGKKNGEDKKNQYL